MIRLILGAAFLLIGAGASAQCLELFISEYVEGTGNNKALEFYNPTNSAIDLSDYRIVRWTNGSTTADQNVAYWVPLTGTIGAQNTYVATINRVDSITTGGGSGGSVIDAALPAVPKVAFHCTADQSNWWIGFNRDWSSIEKGPINMPASISSCGEFPLIWFIK